MEMIGGITGKYVCSHTQAHSCTDASRHTNTHTEVMGLQYYWSAKGETLKCHLYSWDAIYSLTHTDTRTHTYTHSHPHSLYYFMLSKHSE